MDASGGDQKNKDLRIIIARLDETSGDRTTLDVNAEDLMLVIARLD